MNDFLTRNWWTFVLRGAIAIVLGVLAFVVPGPTLVALIAVFAAYAIVDGVLAIIAGARTDRGPRWWFILGGIAGIAIGLFTIYSPGTTAIALVLLIGVWSIATGVARDPRRLAASARDRGRAAARNRWCYLYHLRRLPRRGAGSRGARGPMAHRPLRDLRWSAVRGRGVPSPPVGSECLARDERFRSSFVRGTRGQARQGGEIATLLWLPSGTPGALAPAQIGEAESR